MKLIDINEMKAIVDKTLARMKIDPTNPELSPQDMSRISFMMEIVRICSIAGGKLSIPPDEVIEILKVVTDVQIEMKDIIIKVSDEIESNGKVN